jgi:uncharacterized protein (TIGR00369 family)
MEIEAVFEQIPFAAELGIELDEVSDGHAEGRLPLREEHSSNPERTIAHGGVTYSLADTVGGAAVVSKSESVSPTIDMRMDYLAPATGDLRAVADVVRFGGSVATVDIEVYDTTAEENDRHVATARGVYKTGGQGEETPWTEGVDVDARGALDD